MNQLVFAAFAFLASTGCHAAVTVTYEVARAYATCQFKATINWASANLGNSYGTLVYVKGGVADADCTQGTTLGGTFSEASGSSTFESNSGTCYFEGSTQYTFFVCDSNDQMQMPAAFTSPEFTRGNTTLTACAFHFEKRTDNNYMAKLDLTATHEDGTVPAPGLPSTSTITLTSSAVTGTDCDSLMLTARRPMWITSDQKKETTLSTTVDTENDGEFEFNMANSKPECVTAWMSANGNTAVMKFNEGPAQPDKFYASTDGSVGNNLGLASGCAITWKEAVATTTTTIAPKTTASPGNSASAAPKRLSLWFAFFTTSLRVALFK